MPGLRHALFHIGELFCMLNRVQVDPTDTVRMQALVRLHRQLLVPLVRLALYPPKRRHPNDHSRSGWIRRASKAS